jgi:hypothetical protein
MKYEDKRRLEKMVEEWRKEHGVTPDVPEGDVLKLSWPTGGRGHLGYIDISPDPKRSEIVVVQHGTVDPKTGRGTPCGMTRSHIEEIQANLSEAKAAVDAMKVALEPSWKYTPSVDLGAVRGFKF